MSQLLTCINGVVGPDSLRFFPDPDKLCAIRQALPVDHLILGKDIRRGVYSLKH
jgi:hypothetical protein